MQKGSAGQLHTTIGESSLTTYTLKNDEFFHG